MVDTVEARARVEGLVALCVATWSADDPEPALPTVAGFVASTFSPMVAHVADSCLRQIYPQHPAPPRRGERTAIVIASRSGDLTTAISVARSVDANKRVAPLLFYQSVPNAVAGHIAARWGLGGPVTCLSPARDQLGAALAVAALVIADGDADEALIILVEQSDGEGAPDNAIALLARGCDNTPTTHPTAKE